MSKPAFMVDGHMEMKFLQSICKGHPITRLNINGKDVRISAIAQRVATQSRLLKTCSPIVIFFDREDRKEPADKLTEEFVRELANAGVEADTIVGVSDRMIENWVLADFEVFSEHYGLSGEPEKNFEGTDGKSEIRKLLPANRTYEETSDGVSILKRCRPSIMADGSPSFDAFRKRLDIDCWWLER